MTARVPPGGFMHRRHVLDRLLIGAAVVTTVLLLQSLVRAVPAAETLSAEATIKTAGGVKATAPVTVTIDRFATDAERAELIASIKRGGTSDAHELLTKGGDLGTVQVGGRRTAIKFVYAQPSALGRVIVIVTADPIAWIGAALPGAKPTGGYELGMLILQAVDGSPGHGELMPATKVRVNDAGSIVTDQYNGDVVSLSNLVGR
jgi:hypothetical protein